MTDRPPFVQSTADVAESAQIGQGSKVWHYAQVRENARIGADSIIGRGAYIGTGVVMGDGCKVQILEGASIGASATCVAPITIGRWALVGAGSVVIKDVPDFALVVGSPARRVGWVGKAGVPLVLDDDGTWRCPQSGDRYVETDEALREAAE